MDAKKLSEKNKDPAVLSTARRKLASRAAAETASVT